METCPMAAFRRPDDIHGVKTRDLLGNPLGIFFGALKLVQAPPAKKNKLR